MYQGLGWVWRFRPWRQCAQKETSSASPPREVMQTTARLPVNQYITRKKCRKLPPHCCLFAPKSAYIYLSASPSPRFSRASPARLEKKHTRELGLGLERQKRVEGQRALAHRDSSARLTLSILGQSTKRAAALANCLANLFVQLFFWSRRDIHQESGGGYHWVDCHSSGGSLRRAEGCRLVLLFPLALLLLIVCGERGEERHWFEFVCPSCEKKP